MNILFIPTTIGLSKPICGGQNRFNNIVKELKKRGNNIIILEPDSFSDPNDKELAIMYYYKEYKLFGNGLFTFFRDLDPGFIYEVFQILKNEDIDIIDVSFPVGGIILTKILSKLKKNNIPIIYGPQNFETDFMKETFANNKKYPIFLRFLIPYYINFMEKLVCKFVADAITSVSESDKTRFVHSFDLDNEKVFVVPSGSHVDNYKNIVNYKHDKIQIKNRFGLSDYKIIIFFHGSYFYLPNQNAVEYIKSVLAPKFNGNNEILFLVGGNEVPIFKEDNILSLGFIKNLNEVLGIVDIAIVPIEYGAGTKIKFLDYLSAGLPIVTTKKGSEGIKVENNKHAKIVNSLNSEFEEALQYLINNKYEREKMGINAEKLVKEHYDWRIICSKLENFYMKSLEKKND